MGIVILFNMEKEELIKKIMQKKEFSQLPLKDVEMAFEKFDKPRNADYQKIKLTRQFLRKIFSGFSSRKVLHKRDEDVEWYLMKHKSTKERYPYYEEVYSRCFEGFPDKFSVIDLGAGINGLSYWYMIKSISFPTPNPHPAHVLTLDINDKEFAKSKHSPTHIYINNKESMKSKYPSVINNVHGKLSKYKIDYIGIEAVGQFVELMNDFFNKNKINGKALHESLFEIEKIKKYIKQVKGTKIIFLFKVVDSLEVMERDYSKKFLEQIVPLSDRVVVSYATRSLGKRTRFSAQRGWIINFIKDNFNILDDFELGGERYLVFEGK